MVRSSLFYSLNLALFIIVTCNVCMLSFMERKQPCCCCQYMLSTQPKRDIWAASQELCCAVVTLPLTLALFDVH